MGGMDSLPEYIKGTGCDSYRNIAFFQLSKTFLQNV